MTKGAPSRPPPPPAGAAAVSSPGSHPSRPPPPKQSGGRPAGSPDDQGDQGGKAAGKSGPPRPPVPTGQTPVGSGASTPSSQQPPAGASFAALNPAQQLQQMMAMQQQCLAMMAASGHPQPGHASAADPAAMMAAQMAQMQAMFTAMAAGGGGGAGSGAGAVNMPNMAAMAAMMNPMMAAAGAGAGTTPAAVAPAPVMAPPPTITTTNPSIDQSSSLDDPSSDQGVNPVGGSAPGSDDHDESINTTATTTTTDTTASTEAAEASAAASDPDQSAAADAVDHWVTMSWFCHYSVDFHFFAVTFTDCIFFFANPQKCPLVFCWPVPLTLLVVLFFIFGLLFGLHLHCFACLAGSGCFSEHSNTHTPFLTIFSCFCLTIFLFFAFGAWVYPCAVVVSVCSDCLLFLSLTNLFFAFSVVLCIFYFLVLVTTLFHTTQHCSEQSLILTFNSFFFIFLQSQGSTRSVMFCSLWTCLHLVLDRHRRHCRRQQQQHLQCQSSPLLPCQVLPARKVFSRAIWTPASPVWRKISTSTDPRALVSKSKQTKTCTHSHSATGLLSLTRMFLSPSK